MNIGKPVKKLNNYISSIKKEKKNLRIKINNATFINIKKNSADNEVISLYLNDTDNKELIKEIDNEVLESVVKNNNTWFNNNLTNEKIIEYFRDSFNDKKSVISLLISDLKLPIIYYNNKIIESLADIKIDSSHIINVEIECEGLYFYKDKFGLRWIIRILNIYEPDKYINHDEIVATKDDIENEWELTINEFNITIEEDREKLKNKLKLLEAFKDRIIREYQEAKNISTADSFWNSSLTKISREIAKYYNGTLKL